MSPVLSWRPRLPRHLTRAVPEGEALSAVQRALADAAFPTVCREARCPNRTDCWARGTLAFQILGDVCTRRCAFCAEKTGRPGAVDPAEPAKLLRAVQKLSLKHVVITSPARDDLDDQGAGQFAACVDALRDGAPGVTVEVLTPDFQGRRDLLERVFRSAPEVFNHNVETVERLSPRVRARATHRGSLAVLAAAAAAGLRVKSGLMVGLGETEGELIATFAQLRDAGVRMLTVGQYLPPGPAFFPVDRFYTPDEFRALGRRAKDYFENVSVGPLVRSSYHADELLDQP
ncbi:MAG: lipoyl synthase [Elusimicrobia bacterium]|jgi:lipoic acid synthetase|nr:MAG: lipoyl synthase [Elusimicrobiota bacterium]